MRFMVFFCNNSLQRVLNGEIWDKGLSSWILMDWTFTHITYICFQHLKNILL